MTISMYEASVPVFIRYLGNLRAILESAAGHAESQKIDPLVLPSSRLFPDMLPLNRQVHLVSDMAKSGASRLAAADVPSFEDTETTFTELYARIDKTVAHLKTFKPEQIDGSEDRIITLPTANGPMSIPGQQYLTQFLIPNFFFHITMVHAILRHNGVAIGKSDFLGVVKKV